MKLTEQKQFVFAFIAAFAIGAVWFLIWVDSLPTIARDAGKVKVGMTYDEVVAVWSQPVRLGDCGDGEEVASWDPRDGRMVVLFEHRKVKSRVTYPMEVLDRIWLELRMKFGGSHHGAGQSLQGEEP